MSFDARVLAVVAAQDGDGLLALWAEATTKSQRKAVKKAHYLLRQRGVAVPTLKTEAAPGTRLVSAAPLAMMAPPRPDDGRTFTLALPEAGQVRVVEARFLMPDGLSVLQGSLSSRADYASWAKTMCRRPGQGLPERVGISPRLQARKLGEIRHALAGGRVGPGVDRALAARITAGVAEPAHPMLSVECVGTPMSAAALAKTPWRVAAFRHQEPLARIGGRLDRRARSLQGVDSPVVGWAREWAEEWGRERIVETLLDCAAFAEGLSDADAQATYVAAARNAPVAFVAALVGLFLGR